MADDLITVAELQGYMTRVGSPGPTDTTLMAALITRTSAAVSGYIQRDLFTGSRTQVASGSGGAVLVFEEWPATAVASVTVNGVAVPPAPDDVQPGYAFDEQALYLRGRAFTRGVKNVRVSYTAGYASIPEDVKHAVCELVMLRLKERDWIGVTSKALAGETVSYVQGEMRPAVRAILDRYRRAWR